MSGSDGSVVTVLQSPDAAGGDFLLTGRMCATS